MDWARVSVPPQRQPRGSQQSIRTVRTLLKGLSCNGTILLANFHFPYAVGQNVPDYDPEQSDLLLYHVRILEERGDLSEALTLLDMNAKSRAIVDRVAVTETRGMICTRGTPAPNDRLWPDSANIIKTKIRSGC